MPFKHFSIISMHSIGKHYRQSRVPYIHCTRDQTHNRMEQLWHIDKQLWTALNSSWSPMPLQSYNILKAGLKLRRNVCLIQEIVCPLRSNCLSIGLCLCLLVSVPDITVIYGVCYTDEKVFSLITISYFFETLIFSLLVSSKNSFPAVDSPLSDADVQWIGAAKHLS